LKSQLEASIGIVAASLPPLRSRIFSRTKLFKPRQSEVEKVVRGSAGREITRTIALERITTPRRSDEPIHNWNVFEISPVSKKSTQNLKDDEHTSKGRVGID